MRSFAPYLPFFTALLSAVQALSPSANDAVLAPRHRVRQHPHRHRHGHGHHRGSNQTATTPASSFGPRVVAPPDPYAGNWRLAVTGNSGISAQQLSLVDDNHVIIYDKVEQNPLQVSGHPAYGAIYRLNDSYVRPLQVHTNSFCAGGAFLGNGTMLSVGGNSAQLPNIYNDTEGRQSLRFFTPCGPSEACDVYDNPVNHYLLAQRWYPSVMRFFSGAIFIVGGMSDQGYSNTPALNEPTFEYFPRRTFPFTQPNGLIYSQFLNDTLNANLFPIMFALPDSTIFMAARDQAMIYNPYTNVERRLPPIPNGIKLSYPMAGSGLLLQLNSTRSWLPEVMLCGGSNVTDAVGSNSNIALVSSQSPASAQCVRMQLNSAGIAKGWAVEQMPYQRTMHSMVLLPDGNVLIVNGAQTGVSGYGSVKDSVGPNSNADHPAFQPVLYRPNAPPGQRFSTSGIPASTIPRMYHSSAMLMPSGQIMIAGSAPNLYATYNVTYQTEDRVETLTPPFVNGDRPSITSFPSQILFASNFTVSASLPASLIGQNLIAVLMDPGFSTHGVLMNSRNVKLDVLSVALSSVGGVQATTAQLTVAAPPHNGVFQPGPGWLYVLAGGVPSAGFKTLIGRGTLNQ